MSTTDEIDIGQWIEDVITGPGGLHDFEKYELAVFSDRDHAVAKWVIRCLANIECEKSGAVLQTIIDRRKHLESVKDRETAPN